jgi:hypothetical protein
MLHRFQTALSDLLFGLQHFTIISVERLCTKSGEGPERREEQKPDVAVCVEFHL